MIFCEKCFNDKVIADIIKSLLYKQKYSDTSLTENQEIVSKSFKVGKDTWESFSEYCRVNDLKRSVILTNLIDDFLNKK